MLLVHCIKNEKRSDIKIENSSVHVQEKNVCSLVALCHIYIIMCVNKILGTFMYMKYRGMLYHLYHRTSG